METTFDNVLNQLYYLDYQDFKTLNNLKPKAYELIKRTFPIDNESIINELRGIQFQPRKTSPFWSEQPQMHSEVWQVGLAKFIGIIEAKKETNEYNLELAKKTPKKNPLEKDNKALAQRIVDIQNEQFKELDKQAKVISEKNNDLVKLNKSFEAKEKELKAEKLKIKRYNATFWTIIVGIPSLLFFIGYYLGTNVGANRYDAEKLSMRDSIISLKQQNQILKKQVTPKAKSQSPK